MYPDKSAFFIGPCEFCSTCFVQNLQHVPNKLDSSAIKCVFLGYKNVFLLAMHELRKVIDILILCIVSFVLLLMWPLSQFRILLILLLLFLSLCLVLRIWRKR